MTTGLYYDRDGVEIDSRRYLELLRDDSYVQVACDMVGAVQVSTVWLGLNHNHARIGAPLIFETAVFGGGSRGVDLWRYATLEQALAGHAECLRAERENGT